LETKSVKETKHLFLNYKKSKGNLIEIGWKPPHTKNLLAGTLKSIMKGEKQNKTPATPSMDVDTFQNPLSLSL